MKKQQIAGLVARSMLGLLVTSACQGQAKQDRASKYDTILPSLSRERAQPLSDESDADASAAMGECVSWITEIETWDPATGAFESLYTCATGGDIASVHTVGQDDLAGNGSYETSYALRDGSSLVWTYTYTTSADGLSSETQGSSSNGESYLGQYEAVTEGTQAHEEYADASGSYVYDGVYAYGQDANGQQRWNGSGSFDDLATESSPDWTFTQSQSPDGRIIQASQGVSEGWGFEDTYILEASGASSFDFIYDDPATGIERDYVGSYLYGVDGSASGDYLQAFEDGSSMNVHDSFSLLSPELDESWSFDDIATDRNPDQTGAMHYLADGSGTGSVSTFGPDGDVQVCQVSVAADGSSSETCEP